MRDIKDKSKKLKFENEVFWGCDLASEHEKYLTDKVFCGPIIVYNYPADIKAFYMKMNEDGKTVQAMDVLVPRIGELIGGSAREDNLEVLDARLDALKLNKEDYWWYRDLRRYGSVPHAGFGRRFAATRHHRARPVHRQQNSSRPRHDALGSAQPTRGAVTSGTISAGTSFRRRRIPVASAHWEHMLAGAARRLRACGTHLLSTTTTPASGGTSILALRAAFSSRVYMPVAAARLGIDGGREESRSGRSRSRRRCRAADPSPPAHGPAACSRRPRAATARRCAVTLRTRMD